MFSWLSKLFKRSEKTQEGDVDYITPPEPRILNQIASTFYIKNVNDCSNKAGQYYRKLKELGYDDISIIIIRKKNKTVHAVVKYKTIYIDCTNATYSSDLKTYGDYITTCSESYIYNSKEFK